MKDTSAAEGTFDAEDIDALGSLLPEPPPYVGFFDMLPGSGGDGAAPASLAAQDGCMAAAEAADTAEEAATVAAAMRAAEDKAADEVFQRQLEEANMPSIVVSFMVTAQVQQRQFRQLALDSQQQEKEIQQQGKEIQQLVSTVNMQAARFAELKYSQERLLAFHAPSRMWDNVTPVLPGLDGLDFRGTVLRDAVHKNIAQGFLDGEAARRQKAANAGSSPDVLGGIVQSSNAFHNRCVHMYAPFDECSLDELLADVEERYEEARAVLAEPDKIERSLMAACFKALYKVEALEVALQYEAMCAAAQNASKEEAIKAVKAANKAPRTF